MTEKESHEGEQQEMFNLTDTELDDLLKQAMREAGYKTFINYQGVEEPL